MADTNSHETGLRLAFELLRLLSVKDCSKKELLEVLNLRDSTFKRLLRTVRILITPIQCDHRQHVYRLPPGWKIDREWLLSQGPFLPRNEGREGKDEASAD